MTEPMRKIAAFSMRILIIYKKGIIKMLSESIPPPIPLFPNSIIGKEIIHANIIELNAISDQVKVPAIAKSQMQHTAMPIRIAAVKIIEITVFFLIFSFSSI